MTTESYNNGRRFTTRSAQPHSVVLRALQMAVRGLVLRALQIAKWDVWDETRAQAAQQAQHYLEG